MQPQNTCIKTIFFLLMFVTKIHVRCNDTTSDEPTDADYEELTGSYSSESVETTERTQSVDSSTQIVAAAPLSTTKTPLHPTMLPRTTSSTTIRASLRPTPGICPAECVCAESLRLIDCSNRGLRDIPAAFPSSAIKIDLSRNRLARLNVSSLQNCEKLRVLILSHNQLEAIDENKAFAKLNHLEYIDVSSNKLSLNGDEFSLLRNLRNLTLANNVNLNGAHGELLRAPYLEALNLSNCGLDDLSGDSFAGLTKLKSLDLRNNSFTLTAGILKPLEELSSLQVSSVDKDSIRGICKDLKGIDLISLPEYDVSCYQIASDSSFENSIVYSTAATTVAYEDGDHDDYPVDDAEPEQSSDVEQAPPVKEAASVEAKPVDAGQQVHTMSQNATTEVNSTMETNKSGDNVKRVDISSQSLNTILISIMAVTLVGLLIGVVCRLDCCGIKTKLCRTRRRQTPTDQVRPAEEIPLNKI